MTQVISGSSKIGGTPTLGIEFKTLVAANGSSVPIGGQLLQLGASDTAKDAAKILVAQRQAQSSAIRSITRTGTVVGGILGGAAGTAAGGQKTGGEVVLPTGTVVSVSTGASFSVD